LNRNLFVGFNPFIACPLAFFSGFRHVYCCKSACVENLQSPSLRTFFVPRPIRSWQPETPLQDGVDETTRRNL
jgi:hypothetical protein